MGQRNSKNSILQLIKETNVAEEIFTTETIKNLTETDKTDKIRTIKKQLEKLSDDNLHQQNILLKNLCLLLENCKETNHESIISTEILIDYINILLKNEKVNINYLPDSVEKQIYYNTFSLLLNMLSETLKNTKINFFGHDIKIIITPK